MSTVPRSEREGDTNRTRRGLADHNRKVASKGKLAQEQDAASNAPNTNLDLQSANNDLRDVYHDLQSIHKELSSRSATFKAESLQNLADLEQEVCESKRALQEEKQCNEDLGDALLNTTKAHEAAGKRTSESKALLKDLQRHCTEQDSRHTAEVSNLKTALAVEVSKSDRQTKKLAIVTARRDILARVSRRRGDEILQLRKERKQQATKAREADAYIRELKQVNRNIIAQAGNHKNASRQAQITATDELDRIRVDLATSNEAVDEVIAKLAEVKRETETVRSREADLAMQLLRSQQHIQQTEQHQQETQHHLQQTEQQLWQTEQQLRLTEHREAKATQAAQESNAETTSMATRVSALVSQVRRYVDNDLLDALTAVGTWTQGRAASSSSWSSGSATMQAVQSSTSPDAVPAVSVVALAQGTLVDETTESSITMPTAERKE